MKIFDEDKNVLRLLAAEKKRLSEKIGTGSIELWKNTNDLKMTRPPVFINEIPWHEMNVNNELTLLCRDEHAKSLRKSLDEKYIAQNTLKAT